MPFDPVAVFGRVRAPVLVTVAGHAPFRTHARLVRRDRRSSATVDRLLGRPS